MEIIIEDNVLYRENKKWVKRLCKLARTNNFSDSVKLLVCTSDDGKSKRVSKKLSTSLLNKHVIYGHLHGVHMGNQSFVMYIVCKSTVECLAFEDFDTMKLWSDLLGKHLHDISQFADLVYADKHGQLKNKLEGRLFFNCSHISFIRSPSTCEPKLLMSWKIADIMEYGSKNAEKKCSMKSKPKNNFVDESQNLFIMKVSPMCQKAPITHIFSCKDPKQFCSLMETLSSNQDHLLSRKGSEMKSQRSRMDSFSTFLRRRTDSESSPDYDFNQESPGVKTLRFFPETGNQETRNPRYQRSMSEVRYGRLRLQSGDSIQEKEEVDVTDHSVGILSQSDGARQCMDSEGSPTSEGTLTWLERYPFERERGRGTHTIRRQMSEGSQDTGYNGSTSPWSIDNVTLPRLKSRNNYCSLLNIRHRNDSATEPSLPYEPYCIPPQQESKTTNEIQENGVETGTPAYVNLSSPGILDRREARFGVAKTVSPYVNIEFDDLVHEISDYCMVDQCPV